jgi:hypothetical protein
MSSVLVIFITLLSTEFNVIVNTSNVYIGASVKGLGPDNSDTGKVISVDTVDKTCIVQFSESVTTSFEIGKSSFYKLFFTAPGSRFCYLCFCSCIWVTYLQ